MLWVWLAGLSAVLWLSILALPWQPWRVREALDSADQPPNTDLSDVTVLIPARNEAQVLPHTLRALALQGDGLRVVLVDDQSDDGTARIARGLLQSRDRVLSAAALPAGWSGKLWALEQARGYATTPLILLLDADIVLDPGLIATLRAKLLGERLQFISLMARLRAEAFWERALMPAFVYFFKLLYPFRLANYPAHPRIAAAAGGCILLEARVLDRIGGFEALRGALIDDCTLAARVKAQGFAVWIGLTHSVHSIRRYDTLQAVWNMVARSAFTQLRYSWLVLIAVTAIFAVAFWSPLLALSSGVHGPVALALIALAAMTISYLPMVRFYALSPAWALSLPIVATLFLVMTWSSAWRWQFGRGSAWKGRVYAGDCDAQRRS
jgi:hopene-associated glycosyltransferase HpnB